MPDPKLTVLAAEDSAYDRELLTIVVRRAGLDVDWRFVVSCAELRERIGTIADGAESLPDLAILDLRLGDGYSSDHIGPLRRVLAGRPVIVFTTSSAQFDIDRFAGMDDVTYLVKPHDLKGYDRILDVLLQAQKQLAN